MSEQDWELPRVPFMHFIQFAAVYTDQINQKIIVSTAEVNFKAFLRLGKSYSISSWDSLLSANIEHARIPCMLVYDQAPGNLTIFSKTNEEVKTSPADVLNRLNIVKEK